MRINDSTSITVITSGRDSNRPFVGLKLEVMSTIFGTVSVVFDDIEQTDRLIAELQQAKQYVIDFEAQRGKPRAMSGRN